MSAPNDWLYYFIRFLLIGANIDQFNCIDRLSIFELPTSISWLFFIALSSLASSERCAPTAKTRLVRTMSLMVRCSRTGDQRSLSGRGRWSMSIVVFFAATISHTMGAPPGTGSHFGAAAGRLLQYGSRHFRTTSASIAEMGFMAAGVGDEDDVCCVIV